MQSILSIIVRGAALGFLICGTLAFEVVGVIFASQQSHPLLIVAGVGVIALGSTAVYLRLLFHREWDDEMYYLRQDLQALWQKIEPQLPWIILYWLSGLSVIGAWQINWLMAPVVTLTWILALPWLHTLVPDIMPQPKVTALAPTVFWKRSAKVSS